MVTLLIIVVVLLIGALIYLATLNGKYHVRRSIEIQVAPQIAFDKIRDFRSWKEWSPWLLHEPNTKLEFSRNCDQVGGRYRWIGSYIGEGSITHKKFYPPRRLEQRIEFVKPFKSQAKVWWVFEQTEKGVEVVWNMQGSMPFFMRFLTDWVRQMIEKDYELGLAMLKGRLQPRAEYPRIRFKGITTLPLQTALTLPFAGVIADMVPAMEVGFPRLTNYCVSNSIQMGGQPFCAYHKADIKKMYFECDMAVPVTPDTDPGEFIKKELGGGAFYQVMLAGNYEFLEMAWNAAMGHVQMLRLSIDNKRPSFEVYENDPSAVKHSNQYLTSIYIPLKN